MFEIVLLNNKGERFTKLFDSEFLMNKFINKCKYSKKVTVLSVTKVY